MSLVGRNVGIIARIVAGTIVMTTSVMVIIGINAVIKDGLNICVLQIGEFFKKGNKIYSEKNEFRGEKRPSSTLLCKIIWFRRFCQP